MSYRSDGQKKYVHYSYCADPLRIVSFSERRGLACCHTQTRHHGGGNLLHQLDPDREKLPHHYKDLFLIKGDEGWGRKRCQDCRQNKADRKGERYACKLGESNVKLNRFARQNCR